MSSVSNAEGLDKMFHDLNVFQSFNESEKIFQNVLNYPENHTPDKVTPKPLPLDGNG
jgi:hypothetical protein